MRVKAAADVRLKRKHTRVPSSWGRVEAGYGRAGRSWGCPAGDTSIGRQDCAAGSPTGWLRVVPAVPVSRVMAGLAVRRRQAGQSAEGNLQAGGQYTNLSVRQ